MKNTDIRLDNLHIFTRLVSRPSFGVHEPKRGRYRGEIEIQTELQNIQKENVIVRASISHITNNLGGPSSWGVEIIDFDIIVSSGDRKSLAIDFFVYNSGRNAFVETIEISGLIIGDPLANSLGNLISSFSSHNHEADN